MTATDIGAETKLDCPDSPNAGGIMAPMVAAAVIIIGRIRFCAPAIIALSNVVSRRRYWLIKSISTIELVTTMPLNISIPTKAVAPSVVALGYRAEIVPVAPNGIATNRTSGWTNDFNRHTKITSINMRADAEARASG